MSIPPNKRVLRNHVYTWAIQEVKSILEPLLKEEDMSQPKKVTSGKVIMKDGLLVCVTTDENGKEEYSAGIDPVTLQLPKDIDDEPTKR